MTPLGVPVDPEVNRNFAMVSGPTAACALIDGRGSGGGFEHRERRGVQTGRIAANHELGIGRQHGFQRFAKWRTGGNKNQTRREDVEDQAQLAEVGRD